MIRRDDHRKESLRPGYQASPNTRLKIVSTCLV